MKIKKITIYLLTNIIKLKIFTLSILTISPAFAITVMYDQDVKQQNVYIENGVMTVNNPNYKYANIIDSWTINTNIIDTLINITHNTNIIHISTNRIVLDTTNSITIVKTNTFRHTVYTNITKIVEVVPSIVGKPKYLNIVVNNDSIGGYCIIYPNTTNIIQVSDGVITQKITCMSPVEQSYSDFKVVESYPTLTFPEGSLGKHMQDQILSKVITYGYDQTIFQCINQSGIPTGWQQVTGSSTLTNDITGWTTPTNMLWKQYHTYTHTYARTLKRNTECVFRDVDLSCVSIMNSVNKNQSCGILVTEKHILLADHFSYGTGAKVIFMSMNNQVHTGTVVKAEVVNSDDGMTSDIRIAELNSEVPSYIKPCKLLGQNWNVYLPHRDTDLHNPLMFFIDQRKNIVLTEINKWNSPCVIGGTNLYYSNGVMWDSGHPMCALINNELVLVSLFFYPNIGSFASSCITNLNNKIISWGSTNRVEIVDLSQFTTY